MSASQDSWIRTVYLSGATGPVAAGTCLVKNAAGTRYVISTDDNRAETERRTAGITLKAGDNEEVDVQIQYVGEVPPSITGLGEGTSSLIRVSSTGMLERTDSYDADDDMCGYCDEDGTAYVCFPLVGLTLGGGGGGGATPGGYGDLLTSDGAGGYGEPIDLLGVSRGGTDLDPDDLLEHIGEAVIVNLVGSGYTFAPTGGVGTCTLEQFGAVGNGVADDSAAMTAAVAALTAGTYRTLVLGAATYQLNSGPYVIPTKCSVRGQGRYSSILRCIGDHGCFDVGGDYVSFFDFQVLGDDPTPCTNNHRAQFAIRNGVTGVGFSHSHCLISNVYARDCGGDAFTFRRSQSYSNQVGSYLVGCEADGGWTGFLTAESAEYIQLVGCSAHHMHNYGLSVSSGNVFATGCTFSQNENIAVHLGTGSNDSHGGATGCTINHAGVALVSAGAITNGWVFSGCRIIAGSISLVGSSGVVFDGCEMNGAGYTYTFNASVGTAFNGCMFYGADPTISESNNPSTSFGDDNRLLDGSVPTWIATRQQLAYSFPTDANQTLTKQQSMAQRLVIAAGTVTAGRTLTSTQTAASRREVLVKNNTAQTVTFAWASGTGVTIATTKSAIVGSDGTNAITLLTGA